MGTATYTRSTLFLSKFSELEDPRRINKGNHRHLLSDILLLTISAIISGADDWELVKTFGDSQLDWLKRFGRFENGIPSADTLGRVFSALCPEKFTSCFIDWIKSVRKKHKGEIVAVDGKCIKGG